MSYLASNVFQSHTGDLRIMLHWANHVKIEHYTNIFNEEHDIE
jgi:hypothetical protein